MTTVNAYAAKTADAPLAPLAIERRALGPKDVGIDILYCGVCHTDLHFARNEWGFSLYPVVPGHEIVGRVRETGAGVNKYKTGDLVGVGCLVDSCRICPDCHEGLEQFCDAQISTYNGADPQTGGHTFGGYSKQIVVDQDFVLRVPEGMDPARTAPLLCAGITTYSPLRHWKAGPGKKVGVIGLGGLGHMAVKIAAAMGAEVVLFSTSQSKVEDALKMGASRVVISTDAKQMAAQAGSLHLIVNTVAVSMDLEPYAQTLRRDGTMVMVGVPEPDHAYPRTMGLVMKRRSVAGSLIGGIAETQEMLEFCAKHEILSDIELIAIKDINTAYERMLKSDVRYRFVIDMASL